MGFFPVEWRGRWSTAPDKTHQQRSVKWRVILSGLCAELFLGNKRHAGQVADAGKRLKVSYSDWRLQTIK
jgi:hypothetical protein